MKCTRRKMGGLAAVPILLLCLAAPGAGPADLPDPAAAKDYSPADAVRIGWPAMAGPYGNFLPLRTATAIVDDLSRAKVAWTSETSDLGIGKQGTPFGKSFTSGVAIQKYLGPRAGRHPGNWAGVIVADGKVFGASFRPAGAPVECDFPDGKAGKVRVDAEDFVVAMDFDTGKTLWLTAEPGGMLVGGGKRQGFQVSPVYSAGKVFAMGSTGRLFAYDADTGRKLWQADIGDAHKAMDARRKAILAGLAQRKFSFVQSLPWHTSLIVAGGTLVVPTFSGGTLRGVDPASGRTRWEARGVGSNLTTPSVFRGGGREYVLTANTKGEMRLLEPAGGKELWVVTGLGPAYFTLAPSATHVIVNVNAKAGKDAGGNRVPGYLGAYRISPAKAEPAWKMDQTPANGISCWMDNEARYQFTMRDGLALFYTGGTTHPGDQPARFLIARQDTGQTIAQHVNQGSEADVIAGLWYVIGDKIICRANNCHGPTHGGRHPWVLWSVANNTIARLPGTLDKNEFTNGYEVNMQCPVVDGRLLERSEAGGVVCYDLRRAGK